MPHPPKTPKPASKQGFNREEKDQRDTKTEREIDKTVEDTFPASDPAATY